MSFKLEEVNADADFKELIACEWESYENPFQTFFRLFCPIRGSGSHAREESLTESIGRRSPILRLEKIIGGALWKIHPTSPFEHPEPEEAYWFPEGGEREFVNQALERFETPRATMGQRPQLYLNIIFTHRDYRRQGAADLMMDWGIKKANEMGVEMWLDATIYGIQLYKNYGFVKNHEPNAEWKRLEEELTPMTMWPMWRPATGPYEEGKTVFLWTSS